MLEVLEPLRAYRKVLLALSGGCDSMALFHMLKEWGGVEFVCASVNHGLRAEALAECEQVRAWTGASILHWQGEKPTTGLQRSARDARYALLAAHALEVEADAIITAHTLNDQAETVMMRLFKGSSPSGLAGMAMVASKHNVALVRPLLWVSRANLREYMGDRPFINDPSNENEAYTRVRVRRMMPSFEAEGLTHERLGKFAARQAMQNEAIEFYALQLIETAKADARLLLEAPFAVVLKAFSRLIAGAGDISIPERLEKLEELCVGALEAVAAQEPFHATLRGAKITILKSGVMMVTKAPPRA